MRRSRRYKKTRSPHIPWKAIRKHNRKRKPSSLEKTVQSWLKTDGIKFKSEKAIGNNLHVDIFLEPKTCIELNGCHWHGCIICNDELSEAQLHSHVKDARRYHIIKKLGFDIVVFWECEVERFPFRVRKKLRELGKGVK